jgi:hypothetical protein
MSSRSYKYRLACAVPDYTMADALAKGVRLFDNEAFVHIKEAQDDDFWEIICLFSLQRGTPEQFSVMTTLFNNAVAEVGGREL